MPTTRWTSPGTTAFTPSGTSRSVVPGLRPWWFVVGDSKSVSTQGWPALLAKTVTLPPWLTANSAVSGRTTQSTVDNLTSVLATVSGAAGVAPIVLMNLGANDFVAGTFLDAAYAVTWTANTLQLLDALRVQFPQVRVYMVRAWSQGNNTQADVNATRIDSICAARSFVTIGPDERDFYKGADDGVTNTLDGIHPNAAGTIAIATAWKAFLG